MKPRKTPLIQSIVPNLENYIAQLHLFYSQKIQMIMFKINQLIEIATELTEIPQHLAIEFSYIKTIPKPSQQEREIQRLILKDQIQRFLNLKNQVIDYQTGTKYIFPQLPKIQRNIHKRKYSKSESTSSDSQKNQSLDSMKEICNLLGSLDLQTKTSQEICQSIECIVSQLNGLTIQDRIGKIDHSKSQILQKENLPPLIANIGQKTVQLEKIRKNKKVQLFKLHSSLDQNRQLIDSLSFKQKCQQKLLQLKQLFKVHLEKSVEQVTTATECILTKALRDIKQSDKAYVPIHKISAYFNKVNIIFYRSEGVIKCLHKYLTKKIKQCIIDTVYAIQVNGQQFQIKTNFKLRFFKHILLQNIFQLWLEHAIVDLNKIVKQSSYSNPKQLNLNYEIECETSKDIEKTDNKISHEQLHEIFPISKNPNSFNNLIM